MRSHNHAFIVSMIAAFVVLTATAVPANAMDAAQAIDACGKRTDCTTKVTAGGFDIAVGKNRIYCPMVGQCECVVCSPSKRAVIGRGKSTPIKGAVGSVLATGDSKQPTPKVKGLPVAKTNHNPLSHASPTKGSPPAGPKNQETTGKRSRR